MHEFDFVVGVISLTGCRVNLTTPLNLALFLLRRCQCLSLRRLQYRLYHRLYRFRLRGCLFGRGLLGGCFFGRCRLGLGDVGCRSLLGFRLRATIRSSSANLHFVVGR